MCNTFPNSRTVIDSLTGEWNGIVAEISAETLFNDLMIAGLTWWKIVPLTGGIIDFCIKIFTEMSVLLAIVEVIILEVPVSVSYTDVWAGIRIDVLASTLFGIVSDIGVDMFARVTESMWTASMTTLGSIPMLASEKEAFLFGWKARSSCCSTAWRSRSLHAQIPSCHVWPRFACPTLPQFPNQEPPRAQQLSLPDFLMVPHTWQTGLVGVVVTTGVGIYTLVKPTETKRYESHYRVGASIHLQQSTFHLRLQASTPSNQL